MLFAVTLDRICQAYTGVSRKVEVMHQFSATLKVNLSALRRNWRSLRAQCLGASCGAVVKANAYGLGVAPVVQSLYSEGCREFFVANFDEGLQVRRLLPERCDIYVLQGCCPGMELRFVEEGLLPVIITRAMFDRWLKQAGPVQGRCALKVNTGMNRFGLSLAELAELAGSTDLLMRAGVVTLMSHLACADEPGHELNQVQLQAFRQAVRQVQLQIPPIRASLANSAGILLGAEWHFDLVRPGIALYGGECAPGFYGQLVPVATLVLPVLQIRRLIPGEAVGYGCTFIANRPMRVAVVSGGYADGILRCLSNRAVGWFNRELPLVGRVSMDSCIFDITHLNASEAPQVGDAIELFGEHVAVDALAASADTISYEVLTRLGERLNKLYFEEH